MKVLEEIICAQLILGAEKFCLSFLKSQIHHILDHINIFLWQT